MEEKGEEKKESKKFDFNKIYEKTIDFAFSNNKVKYLIIILAIALVLRFVILGNVGPVADEMVHAPRAINIIHSGVINEQDECPAWFYLTDIVYKIFGVNVFTAKSSAIIFGLLSIIIVYLLVKKNINQNTALIASFLLAVSAYFLRWSLAEMDVAMCFFVLLSFYFFDLKIKEKKVSYLSVMFMAIAVLIKTIAITFIPALVIWYCFVLYKEKSDERKEIIKKNGKRFAVILILFLLFMMPIIAYNLILYKQKGITDVLFSRFFHINPGVYQELQGFDKVFELDYAFTTGLNWAVTGAFMPWDPVIFILGIVGIIVTFAVKDYKNNKAFVLYYVVPFFFLTGTSLLHTHFVTFLPLFCVCSAILINFLAEKFAGKLKISKKTFVFIILIAILIFNLYTLMPNLTSKSAVWKMRDYAVSNINNQDVVIVDARTYRGRIAWMFNDKEYVESSLFPQIYNANQNLSGNSVPTTVYFIECAVDDCGWGTIKDQQDFNKSVEQMADFFKNNSVKEATIYGGGGYAEDSNQAYFNVYKTTMNLKTGIYPYIAQTHDWFYYPVRWLNNDYYDHYFPEGVWQILLNLIGKIMLWLAVILAILSIVLLFKEFKESEFKK